MTTIKTYFPETAGSKGIKLQNQEFELNFWGNPELIVKNSQNQALYKETLQGNLIKQKDNIVHYQTFSGVVDEMKIIDYGIENNIILEQFNNNWQLNGAEKLSFKQFVAVPEGVKILNSKAKQENTDFSDEFFVIEFSSGEKLFFNPLISYDNNATKDEAKLFYEIEEKHKIPRDIQEKASSFHKGIYKIKFVEGGIEVFTEIDLNWLQTAQFPVIIDPTITVGSTASGSFYGPLTHWYGYQRNATLYLQSEIGAYGNITKIEYCKTNTADARTKPTWVYMRNNSASSLTSTDAWNSTTYTSGATVCMNNVNTTQDATIGWKALNLTTSHNYSSGNLQVMVKDAYGGTGSSQYMAQQTLADRQTYKRQDSSDPEDASEMAAESNFATIRITIGSDYCAVTSTNTSYGISNFTTTGGINNINNSTGIGTYTDYTHLFVSQYAGQSVNFSVSPVTGTIGVGIWVDWNNDGDFDDANEHVYNSGTYVSSATGTITVPAGTPAGDYRMRVVGNWLSQNPTPCGDLGNQAYGEAEDYKIVVVVGDGPCASIQTMECGQNYTATLQPNSGYWTNYTGSSLSWNGSEQVWSFTAPTTGSYTFNVNEGTNDADFFLMASCSNTGTNLSSGYWTGSGGTSHTVTLSAGVTYYLIADLHSSNSSTTVTVSATPCTPSFSYSSDYITNFTLSNINNSTGFSSGGYGDYTHLSTILVAGSSTTASLTSSSGSGTHAAAIWIDFNNNGTFEASERVGTLDGIGPSTTVSIPITIPSSAPTGTYILRVVYQYNVSATSIDPCASASYGEGEDYKITVIAPLPVELTLFSAECDNNNNVQLYWTTASEINNDYFEIQRSTDDLAWEVIETVQGAGFSNTSLNYDYLDRENPNANTYYRLRQVDYDGRSKFSDIISIRCENNMEKPTISIYPNPFNSILNIEFKNWDMKSAEIELVDITSRTIKTWKLENTLQNFVYEVNLSNLNPAMYMLKIKTSSGVIMRKIEKQ